MKKQDLARTLAKESRLSRAAANDQIDELVHRILKTVRHGEAVDLPGLGKLVRRPRTPARRGVA